MSDLRRNIKRGLRSIAIGMAGASIVWVFVFVHNFWVSHRVYADPPWLAFNWIHPDGIEIMPGMQAITPEFLQSRSQYIVEITAKSENGVNIPLSANVVFQFPYVVEKFSGTKLGDEDWTFEPVRPPIPFVARGYLRIFGDKEYRNYMLAIKNMPPNGKIRIVLLLDKNPHDRGIISGAGAFSGTNPLLGPPRPIGGPLQNYIHLYQAFSYGGQVSHIEAYAPFVVDCNGMVHMGQFGPAPKNLMREAELP